MNQDKKEALFAHVFLCGQLRCDSVKDAKGRVERKDFWKRQRISRSESEYDQLCRVYYRSFVDAVVDVDDNGEGRGRYGDVAHFVNQIDKNCSFKKGDDCYDFVISSIHLFFVGEVCLFAIETRRDKSVDMELFRVAYLSLREIGSYDKLDRDWYVAGYLEQLKSLFDVYGKEGHFFDLLASGNKLKLFQIVGCSFITDALLYEVGTLSPIGCVDFVSERESISARDEEIYKHSPSKVYYENTIKEHGIFVYQNWCGLALVDTFTMLVDGENMLRDRTSSLKYWTEHYFGIIYIYALYQKSWLFGVNQQFRSPEFDDKSLLEQMKKDEQKYAFSEISYNFLPQKIYRAIDCGLEITAERKYLHEYLEQSAEQQERESEKRMSKIMLALTLLTIFSAINDGVSLTKLGFEWECFFYACGAVVIVVIIVVLIVFWKE